MRLFVPGAFGVVLFFVWVYAIFDIIATESMLVRNLPKMTWLLLVIFIPGVGAVAWLGLGRPLNAGWAPGDTTVRQRRTYVAPEDRDEWRPRSQPSAEAVRRGRERRGSRTSAAGMGSGPRAPRTRSRRRLTRWFVPAGHPLLSCEWDSCPWLHPRC